MAEHTCCAVDGGRPEPAATPAARAGSGKRSGGLPRVAGWSLVGAGLISVLVASGAAAQAGYEAWAWSRSADAARAERQVQAETPLWLDTPAPPSDARTSAAAATEGGVPAAAPTGFPLPPNSAASLVPAPTAAGSARPIPEPTANPEQLELVETDFRFYDPPEAGAHARLAVRVRNSSALSSGPLALSVPVRWFDAFQPFGAVPSVLGDRVEADGSRVFTFPAVAPGSDATLEIHVTAGGDDVDAPTLWLSQAGGQVIGRARPRTVAPRPRPGPAAVVVIPRLNVKSSVVQTPWEPPPFVVGQISGTANVSQGNTVLIGHLRGAAGNVFKDLDRARRGDEVIAVSRGLEYRFVVSAIRTLPKSDIAAMSPSEAPRLTLMTCAGSWDPITRDYSDRLWVVAEPPEQAQATIAVEEERERVEREAAATATAEAEATAAAIPTATPEPGPTESPAATAAPEAAVTTATPTAPPAQPSLEGGLGNTRSDLDAALGPPLGETPDKLVAYRKGDVEVRVAFTPDPPRAALLQLVLPPGAPLALDTAIRESRRFLPQDSEPGAAPEGNERLVVERFASPTLAGVLAGYGAAIQPEGGRFLVVYIKERDGRIGQVLVSSGTDLDALLKRVAR